MEDGPWILFGCTLMTRPFDVATMVPLVILSGVQTPKFKLTNYHRPYAMSRS
jgi:hypothetical protein